TARCPSLTRTSATLSSSTVVPRDGRTTEGDLGRRRGFRRGHLAETVDLPARHRLDAALHRHRAEVDGLDVIAEVRECLPRHDHLGAPRHIGRAGPRPDVRATTDSRSLHPSFPT